VSLFNCKEGVLENWDDDFNLDGDDDDDSKIGDSSLSFTITPGNYKNLKKNDDMHKMLFKRKNYI